MRSSISTNTHTLSGKTDGLQLWVEDVSVLLPAAIHRYETILSNRERNRASDIRVTNTRNAYIAAHGLLRDALSSVRSAVQPHQWRFTPDASGRPQIHKSLKPDELQFSLSHSNSAVACVVAEDCECGVDIEDIPSSLPDLARLCRRALSETEQSKLAAIEPGRRRQHFIRLWSLKEAYAKALGLGMRLPFNTIEFDAGQNGIRMRYVGSTDTADCWSFRQWAFDDRRIVSIALRPKLPKPDWADCSYAEPICATD